jgi:hypothetical protein
MAIFRASTLIRIRIRIHLLTLMRILIWIRLITLMRFRIKLPKIMRFHADRIRIQAGKLYPNKGKKLRNFML